MHFRLFFLAACFCMACSGSQAGCCDTPAGDSSATSGGDGVGTSDGQDDASSQDEATDGAEEQDVGAAEDEEVEGGPDLAPDQPDEASPGEPACGEYGDPVETGQLPAVVNEASGLVLSADPEVLWLHNDSGDVARLFAVGVDGTLLATITLAETPALDWEDMSAGPCADGQGRCLYLADIGDNLAVRETIEIHRIREPDSSLGDQTVTEIETAVLSYPDGSHDSEAMFVDNEANIYLLTKTGGPFFGFYSTPFSPGAEAVVLTDLGRTPSPNVGLRLVTAADLHADQRNVLIRTYNGAAEYTLPNGGVLSGLGEAVQRLVPAHDEAQGESVAYGESGYWHVSEGNTPPIYFVPCLDP